MLTTFKTVFTQKTSEGTTERLLQLAFGYFGLYVLTGFLVKYFDKVLGVGGIQYTFYNTIGGMLVCNIVVIVLGWYKFQSSDKVKVLGMSIPREFLYIIPSGICTAIVIPTTTLMYTLPISIMVAMIIMRASIIVISRIIDAAQIRQGILRKTVYWEENIAVIIALAAVALQLLNFKGASAMVQATGKYSAFFSQLFVFNKGDFDFLGNAAAMTILTFYLIAYTIRIYIMNYYKNTRPKGAIYDTNGFFAIEQISSTTALVLAGFIFFQVVNKPAIIPYAPAERPAAAQAASPSPEREALAAAMVKAEALLASDTSKYTPENRSKAEDALTAAGQLLAYKKVAPETLRAAAVLVEKPATDVKKSFAFQFSDAAKNPTPRWLAAISSGIPFGLAAFCSVFLFMFKGRTATFAGLVNRLTSLIAGTAATIVVWWLIKDQKPPKMEDWFSLALMIIAIYFIGRAEKKRSCELAKAHEIEPEKNSETACDPAKVSN
ncbi:MAG: hypothetical protein A2234_03920 [Elusimicrobia bacterium RIFOXYA2_FULL_58_8]|nr:MAG: hypothetical protein A2285_03040 [Elusimicrobia bacterium RIFOXYA12_FULL_57_11]OGS13544.1 MAG: hypothetical protein A2234_03920 [Elusimicrobia bacterium RIFOXYA2_FULL_58_8]